MNSDGFSAEIKPRERAAAECLRHKDFDFARVEVAVRRGTGHEDRVTVPPESLKPARVEHSEKVRRLHEKDVALGFGSVYLPDALVRMLPGAATDRCRRQCGRPVLLS